MKSTNTFGLESKPKTLKQWLTKHDTLVLVVLIVATVGIFYIP